MNASMARMGCAALVAAQLAACAPILPALPREHPPQFTVHAVATEGDSKIRNLEVGADASKGTGVGMIYGAAQGLSCGIYAFLCVPAGALLGAVAGSGAGALVGTTGALSLEKAAQLRERLAKVVRGHDLTAELRQQLDLHARGLWNAGAVPAPDTGLVDVELQRISLTSTRAEQIGLVVELSVTVQASPGAATVKKPFSCSPGPSGLPMWLDEKSDYVDSLLAGCTRQLAAQIVGELARLRPG